MANLNFPEQNYHKIISEEKFPNNFSLTDRKKDRGDVSIFEALLYSLAAKSKRKEAAALRLRAAILEAEAAEAEQMARTIRNILEQGRTPRVIDPIYPHSSWPIIIKENNIKQIPLLPNQNPDPVQKYLRP